MYSRSRRHAYDGGQHGLLLQLDSYLLDMLLTQYLSLFDRKVLATTCKALHNAVRRTVSKVGIRLAPDDWVRARRPRLPALHGYSSIKSLEITWCTWGPPPASLPTLNLPSLQSLMLHNVHCKHPRLNFISGLTSLTHLAVIDSIGLSCQAAASCQPLNSTSQLSVLRSLVLLQDVVLHGLDPRALHHLNDMLPCNVTRLELQVSSYPKAGSCLGPPFPRHRLHHRHTNSSKSALCNHSLPSSMTASPASHSNTAVQTGNHVTGAASPVYVSTQSSAGTHPFVPLSSNNDDARHALPGAAMALQYPVHCTDGHSLTSAAVLGQGSIHDAAATEGTAAVQGEEALPAIACGNVSPCSMCGKHCNQGQLVIPHLQKLQVLKVALDRTPITPQHPPPLNRAVLCLPAEGLPALTSISISNVRFCAPEDMVGTDWQPESGFILAYIISRCPSLQHLDLYNMYSPIDRFPGCWDHGWLNPDHHDLYFLHLLPVGDGQYCLKLPSGQHKLNALRMCNRSTVPRGKGDTGTVGGVPDDRGQWHQPGAVHESGLAQGSADAQQQSISVAFNRWDMCDSCGAYLGSRQGKWVDAHYTL